MSWEQILKPGTFEKDGITVDLTRPRFVEAARNFARRENHVMLDHDHQSVNCESNGRPAMALGWFTALAVIDGHQLMSIVKHDEAVPTPDPREMADGLWGWLDDITPVGRELLRGGQYAYLSAAFDDKALNEHGKPIGMDILSVAATNIPFLSSMKRLDLGFSRDAPRRVFALSQGIHLKRPMQRRQSVKMMQSFNGQTRALIVSHDDVSSYARELRQRDPSLSVLKSLEEADRTLKTYSTWGDGGMGTSAAPQSERVRRELEDGAEPFDWTAANGNGATKPSDRPVRQAQEEKQTVAYMTGLRIFSHKHEPAIARAAARIMGEDPLANLKRRAPDLLDYIVDSGPSQRERAIYAIIKRNLIQDEDGVWIDAHVDGKIEL